MIVKYKVKFERPPVEKKATQPDVGERTVRMLAMAYHIDRKMQDGVYQDCKSAAAAMKISVSRLSQIMAMLNLSCRIQEAILTGSLLTSESQLRSVIRHADWQQQEDAARRF